jgi:sugar lactone lactonase YvrE
MAGSTRTAAADLCNEGMRSPRIRRPRFMLGLALLGLLLAIVTSSAFADDKAQSASSGPSLQEIEAALEGDGPAPEVIEPTDPLAAEQLPHNDLGRDEAAELLSSVFAPELEGAAGIFDELEVERFHGDHVAVLAPGDQLGQEALSGGESGPTLLESTLPLRTENTSGEDTAVDLTLEQTEGGLQPANPLVEVGVPGQLGEGIALPEVEVEISLASAPAERAASVVKESTAFYPNVAPDSDLSVAPTPLGVETSTQLRSADSPTSQTFDLTLPPGASLREAEGGGAEVVDQDGKPLIVVAAPSALDAAGESVPVRLETAGHSVLITAMPGDETAYPILVDPLWEIFTYGQAGGPKPNYAGWTAETNNPTRFQTAENDWCAACNNIIWGLELNSFSGSATPWSRALWDYRVPRWYEDAAIGKQPTTYINYAMFGRLGYDVGWEQNNHSISYDPIFEYFLWDDNKGFVAIGKRLGTEGNLSDPNYQYLLKNPNNNEDAKQAEIELVTTQPYSQWRHAYVGDAWIELTDSDYPEFPESSSPSGWVNNSPTEKISFKALDLGLGVYEVRVWEPTSNGPLHNVGTQQGCTGAAGHPCPREWSSAAGGPALNYDPSIMPQGEDWVTLDASDAGGRLASQTGVKQPEVRIKVDHTSPTLALSGGLTEQGTLGTKLLSYGLKYLATDGTHATAGALAPFGAQGTGNGQMQRPLGIATDRAGNVWMVDREGNRVEKFDEEGHYLSQFGSKGSGNGQLLEPSNIVRTAAGNLWVTDTGNHRVEEFNAAGQYVQQFGTNGSGGGTQFLAPFGIAATSDGMLWVGDSSTGRVAEFRETVAQASERFLRNATGEHEGSPEFSSPAGLAVDSHNNLWVVDNGHNRLQAFNSKGAFLTRFGTEGTGPGQLKSPYNVAISSSGNLLVTDAGNNRVEEFQPSGAFVRQFGTQGVGSAQFTEPRTLAFGAGNTIFVDDAGNHRIAHWQNAELDPQSGAASVQIKVDGKVVKSDAPGCTTKDCEINHEWTLESPKYSSGQHTVEVTATDGVGLSTTKTLPIELAPDNTSPNVALSGTMTEQATLGASRPLYKLKMSTSDGALTGGGFPAFASSFGASGAGNGQFSFPSDIAVDSSGNTWVADTFNNRIEKFNEKGEYVTKFGSSGASNGQLAWPMALALDSSGNTWVADTFNNRIEKFNEKGEYVTKFGSAGAGNGQLSIPMGIAVDSKGNVWVADTGNGRIEEFSESGQFLKTVGTKGSGTGQLGEPAGIDIGPDGALWVADLQNSRVAEFSEAGQFIRQFGSYGTGNGQFKLPMGVAVDAKGNVWVAEEENARVQEFNEKGEYVTQFGTKGSGAGQFNHPTGIATDSKSAIWIADSSNNRVQRWSLPVTAVQSGIAATEITVDGKRVDSTEVGCAVENCSIAREWTLDSSSYSAGEHAVVAKATDGRGNATTKSLAINIQRDTTKPLLESGGQLVQAPEGWVQQQSYPVTANASDGSGYGVTSLQLKIDGKAVASEAKSCPDGGCTASISKSINMASYSGGAHEAEIVATDGAGNATTKSWTINVDPKGQISAGEATATLEAVEATSPANPIGEGQAGEEYEGTAPGLGIEEDDGSLKATGTQVPTLIGADPSEGAVMEILDDGSLRIPCTNPEESEPEEPYEPEEEDPEELIEPCVTQEELEEDTQAAENEEVSNGLTSIEVVPVGISAESTENELIDETATVAANTTEQVDTVARPLYDGMLNFETIRDASAPESFTWRVNLAEEQELRLIDEKHAEVDYAGTEHTAFSITAATARDAIGSIVPTSLSIDGTDEITLHIHHHAPSPAGGSFVYPVVAGAGWEGGFQTYISELPPPVPPGGEEEMEGEVEVADGAVHVVVSTVGPPMVDTGAIPLIAQSSSVTPKARAYNFDECGWINAGTEGPVVSSPQFESQVSQQCHGHIDGTFSIRWAMSMSGVFHYKYGHWVWVNGPPTCREWGPERPAQVHCHMSSWGPSSDGIDVVGDFRFHPNILSPSPFAYCYRLDGRLPIRPGDPIPGEPVFHGYQVHNPHYGVFPSEPCNWDNFPYSLGR